MSEVTSERSNGRRRVQTVIAGPSKTEQHHKNEVNINQIVARYRKTGIMPRVPQGARYGDFTQVNDYHQAVQAVRDVETAFMSLPSSLRKRFENDPGQLVQFLDNPENRAEAEELGLLEREAASQEPQEVPPEAPEEPSDGQTE